MIRAQSRNNTATPRQLESLKATSSSPSTSPVPQSSTQSPSLPPLASSSTSPPPQQFQLPSPIRAVRAQRPRLAASAARPRASSYAPALSSTQPIPVDLSQSVILSGHELNHYYRIASFDDSNMAREALRRAALRDQSAGRYQNWGNTLEAQRTRKKHERDAKMSSLELQQRSVDLEESEYQEAQRRVVIDRANRLLWQDTDAVKNFHGGLLLSSVLKERESQLELSHAKKEQQRQIAQSYHDMGEEDRLASIDMSAIEAAQRHARARESAADQLLQLKQVRQSQTAERALELAEGDRIKRQALAAQQELKDEVERKNDARRARNHDYALANLANVDIKNARRAADLADDAAIASFALEKERLNSVRRAAEVDKFTRQQERFELMLAKQFAHLGAIKSAEAARLATQSVEVEQRDVAKLAREAAKQESLARVLKSSREAQIERKAREKQRAKEEGAVIANEWKVRNKEMEEDEWLADKAEIESALRLQQALRQQMMSKEEVLRSTLAKEREESAMMTDARIREDDVLHAYCVQQLGATQLRGKSTVPLQLVLHSAAMKSAKPGNYPQAANRG